MVRQHEGFDEPAGWDAALLGAAALANSLFSSGLKVVVVEGKFFTPDECRKMRDNLRLGAKVKYVTLKVSYDETLRRVQGDVSRKTSRDPEFLKRLHDGFENALPYLKSVSVIVHAEKQTPEEIAELIVDSVLA
jgi:hypothetical protein